MNMANGNSKVLTAEQEMQISPSDRRIRRCNSKTD